MTFWCEITDIDDNKLANFQPIKQSYSLRLNGNTQAMIVASSITTSSGTGESKLAEYIDNGALDEWRRVYLYYQFPDEKRLLFHGWTIRPSDSPIMSELNCVGFLQYADMKIITNTITYTGTNIGTILSAEWGKISTRYRTNIEIETNTTARMTGEYTIQKGQSFGSVLRELLGFGIEFEYRLKMVDGKRVGVLYVDNTVGGNFDVPEGVTLKFKYSDQYASNIDPTQNVQRLGGEKSNFVYARGKTTTSIKQDIIAGEEEIGHTLSLRNEDGASLATKAQEYLDQHKSPDVVFEVELNKVDFKVGDFKPGDNVPIFVDIQNPRLNVDDNYRIVETGVSVGSDYIDTLKVGKKPLSVVGFENVINRIKKLEIES